MSLWAKLHQDMHADARLRKARARTIWPWVICRLRDGDGVASDNALDPWRASDDHDGDISEAQAVEKIASLKAVGLLVPVEGGWATPNWIRIQSDPTNAERQRRFKENAKAAAALVTPVTPVTVTDSYVTPVTPVTVDQIRSDQIRSAEPPKAPRAKTEPQLVAHVATEPQGGGITLFELERLAIDCIPVTSRRGKPLSLDGVSVAALAKLVADHGPQSVWDTLQDCGGMDLPVQAAKARLAKVRPLQPARDPSTDVHAGPTAEPKRWTRRPGDPGYNPHLDIPDPYECDDEKRRVWRIGENGQGPMVEGTSRAEAKALYNQAAAERAFNAMSPEEQAAVIKARRPSPERMAEMQAMIDALDAPIRRAAMPEMEFADG